MSDYALDDAAAAALAKLRRERVEHVGVLYEQAGGIERTAPVTSGDNAKVRGAFRVPPGSLRGLYHNHPKRTESSGRQELHPNDGFIAKEFSPGDRETAKRLGVPSYISSGDRIYRLNPQTGRSEEVLAQLPMESLPARLEAAMNTAPKYK